MTPAVLAYDCSDVFMIVQGLAVLGYRVMETVGRDITDINFSRGFAIELGSTLSVVLASVVGESSLVQQCRLCSHPALLWLCAELEVAQASHGDSADMLSSLFGNLPAFEVLLSEVIATVTPSR